MAETRNQNGIGVKCILFCWHQIDSMQSNSSKFSEWLSLIVLQIYDTWKTSQPVGLLAHSSNNLGLVLTSGSICGVCMLPCNYVRFPRCLREFNGKWWWIELNKCEWLVWTLSWRATFLYSPRLFVFVLNLPCNYICACIPGKNAQNPSWLNGSWFDEKWKFLNTSHNGLVILAPIHIAWHFDMKLHVLPCLNAHQNRQCSLWRWVK